MTIGETVRQGQELICAMEVQRLVNVVHQLDKKLDDDGKRIAFLVGVRGQHFPE
jgi:hypothetical protein